MFMLVLEKAAEPEINICWISEKAREFQKNIYFCFIDYLKAFHCVLLLLSHVSRVQLCVDHNKLWKILQ